MNAINEHTKFNLPTLADRAMLVRLTRKLYQPYAFDKVTTLKVELDTGVRKAGRFNKRLLLDCFELKECNQAFNDVYTYHMLNTAPWLDDGVRVLPAASYFDYSQALRGLIDEAEKQVKRLAERWDIIVADDMSRLGSLACSEDYPTDIRSCYAAAVKYLPIPQTGDFRVEISDEDRASLDNAIHEAEANVSKYLLAEMLEPIKRAAEKLATPIGAEGSVFRNSLLTNISDVVARAKRLNVGDDEDIRALVGQIEQEFCRSFGAAPDMLREDDTMREAAKAKLNEIMGRFEGLF